MNRAWRRADKKKGLAKKKYSLQDVQQAMNIALEMKKHSKGHLFSKSQKDRCVFCGVTMKTKKQCKFWFFTFMDRTQTVLINPTFFTADNVEALWLQQSTDYQDVQIPLNMSKK